MNSFLRRLPSKSFKLMGGAGGALILTSQLKSFSSVVAEGSTTKTTIYQYQICPFCQRTEAYLDFMHIDYSAIEVNPLSKSELKSIKTDHKKVPIAVVGEQVIVDSNNIIDFFTKSLASTNGNPDIDVKKFLSEDSAQWNEWSEKKLAVLLYPNITRSFSESWECFGYSTDVKSWNIFQQYLVRISGPIFMSFANGKIKKKYGIVDERQELHDLLLEWTTALANKKFLHGDQPSLPDVLVYGVLRAIERTQTFADIMERNLELKTWYANMAINTPSHRTN